MLMDKRGFARPAAFLLWWTLAPMTTSDTAMDSQRPRRRGTPLPALIPIIRAKQSGGGGLYGCIPSFLLPDGHALTYHQHRAILPPALGHSAIQTAPAHKKEQATGVRWLGWTGMLACLRSPAYPVHVATDTCLLDQSILI